MDPLFVKSLALTLLVGTVNAARAAEKIEVIQERRLEACRDLVLRAQLASDHEAITLVARILTQDYPIFLSENFQDEVRLELSREESARRINKSAEASSGEINQQVAQTLWKTVVRVISANGGYGYPYGLSRLQYENLKPLVEIISSDPRLSAAVNAFLPEFIDQLKKVLYLRTIDGITTEEMKHTHPVAWTISLPFYVVSKGVYGISALAKWSIFEGRRKEIIRDAIKASSAKVESERKKAEDQGFKSLLPSESRAALAVLPSETFLQDPLQIQDYDRDFRRALHAMTLEEVVLHERFLNQATWQRFLERLEGAARISQGTRTEFLTVLDDVRNFVNGYEGELRGQAWQASEALDNLEKMREFVSTRISRFTGGKQAKELFMVERLESLRKQMDGSRDELRVKLDSVRRWLARCEHARDLFQVYAEDASRKDSRPLSLDELRSRFRDIRSSFVSDPS